MLHIDCLTAAYIYKENALHTVSRVLKQDCFIKSKKSIFLSYRLIDKLKRKLKLYIIQLDHLIFILNRL